MTSWGGYQSLIQLGVALNFAYASLETISQQSLSILSDKQHKALRAIQAAVRDKQPIKSSPVAYNRLARQYEIINAWSLAICRCNPYISVSCGFLGLALLLFSSVYANAIPKKGEIVLIVSISYAWFVLAVGSQIALRLWIAHLTPKIEKVDLER